MYDGQVIETNVVVDIFSIKHNFDYRVAYHKDGKLLISHINEEELISYNAKA